MKFDFLLGIALALTPHPHKADHYANFADLAAHETAGVDYRVRTQKGDGTAILAIHGGGIESGTSSLAEAIAGREHTAYWFECLKHADCWNLHITATHFDEPTALKVVEHATRCLALHEFMQNERRALCIGGRNDALAEKVRQALKATSLAEEINTAECEHLLGRDEKNIVNRCTEGGVQIEMSTRLGDSLNGDREKFAAFVRAVRSSLGDR